MIRLRLLAGFAGIVLGILGTLGFQAVSGTADIDVDCSSNISNYSCVFFNKGPESGAQCIVVTLTRNKATDEYVKPSEIKQITGSRLCSGVLAKGQDRKVEGSGFFTNEGKAANATELCQIKSQIAHVAGCEVDYKVMLRTY